MEKAVRSEVTHCFFFSSKKHFGLIITPVQPVEHQQGVNELFTEALC